MDLGTAPLFDLTAPAAEAGEPRCRDPRSCSPRSATRRSSSPSRRSPPSARSRNGPAQHIVDDEADAATLIERGLDTGLPLAGPGAPLISDFAVMELSALAGSVPGLGSQLRRSGPRARPPAPAGLWARLLDGEVPVWKALRIADYTRLLPAEAAAFVDRQLAPFAHGCSWAQVDRLVEKPSSGSTPKPPRKPPGGPGPPARRPRPGPVDYDGIAHGSTALDTADALDLEQAIARRAKLDGQLGDTDSLDVRRAKALGEIAREDLILDLRSPTPTPGRSPAPSRSQDRAHPPPLRRPTRRSAGSGTPAPRSAWSRSRPGSAWRTPR